MTAKYIQYLAFWPIFKCIVQGHWVYSQSGSHHYHPSPDLSHLPKLNYTHQTPAFCTPPTLAISIFLSVYELHYSRSFIQVWPQARVLSTFFPLSSNLKVHLHCSTVLTHHVLFIHLSVCGHLGLLPLCAMVNHAALNVGVQISSLCFQPKVLLGMSSEVEMLDHMERVDLISWRTAILKLLGFLTGEQKQAGRWQQELKLKSASSEAGRGQEGCWQNSRRRMQTAWGGEPRGREEVKSRWEKWEIDMCKMAVSHEWWSMEKVTCSKG